MRFVMFIQITTSYCQLLYSYCQYNDNTYDIIKIKKTH